MALSGILFIFWRLFEIVTLIPILGMLAYFVHGYVSSNQLTPDFILVLFITSVLAAAWAVATLVSYARARHSALFVALVDLGFLAALIASVVQLKGLAAASCSNFAAAPFYFNLGVFGYYGRQSNSPWASDAGKTCTMLKACFALAIMNILFFFFTFLLALLVARHHRRDNERVVVKREVHGSRHAHRRSSRNSRDYDNRPSSGTHRPRHRSSSRRRNYYV
ncbi:hypothetical protein LTR66_013453 [Elasticomyces elasticus]|nr:hypothetical protein LTR66_013453 [Elasticomyces elasticus]KAK4984180.1 hypothetical protein LTR50_006764 [Elasticomyces elasticus]